eukprot:2526667-Rhodomonas_salina.1
MSTPRLHQSAPPYPISHITIPRLSPAHHISSYPTSVPLTAYHHTRAHYPLIAYHHSLPQYRQQLSTVPYLSTPHPVLPQYRSQALR